MNKNYKKIIVVIALALNAHNGWCQTDSSEQKKIAIGFTLLGITTSQLSNVPIAFVCNIQKGKSSIFFGPRISTVSTRAQIVECDPNSLYYGTYHYNSNFLQNIGFIGGYQYAPFRTGEKFKFFFEYTFSYFSQKVWNSCPGERIFTVHSIQNMLGYGLKLKVLKRFHLYQGLSTGPAIYFNEMPGGETKSTTDLLFLAKFGIGYGF